MHVEKAIKIFLNVEQGGIIATPHYCKTEKTVRPLTLVNNSSTSVKGTLSGQPRNVRVRSSVFMRSCANLCSSARVAEGSGFVVLLLLVAFEVVVLTAELSKVSGLPVVVMK